MHIAFNGCKNNFSFGNIAAVFRFHFFLDHFKRCLCHIGSGDQLRQKDGAFFKRRARIIERRNQERIDDVHCALFFKQLQCDLSACIYKTVCNGIG
ncbi:hypothetical protein SDC9_168302 [bioreactor metagenome]|uniref:Uncharacterized protein n=1 Tax=bioreactor metagenome TaxID=1076179 RepID=A0A645GAK9_9ZZZZ